MVVSYGRFLRKRLFYFRGISFDPSDGRAFARLSWMTIVSLPPPRVAGPGSANSGDRPSLSAPLPLPLPLSAAAFSPRRFPPPPYKAELTTFESRARYSLFFFFFTLTHGEPTRAIPRMDVIREDFRGRGGEGVAFRRLQTRNRYPGSHLVKRASTVSRKLIRLPVSDLLDFLQGTHGNVRRDARGISLTHTRTHTRTYFRSYRPSCRPRFTVVVTT